MGKIILTKFQTQIIPIQLSIGICAAMGWGRCYQTMQNYQQISVFSLWHSSCLKMAQDAAYFEALSYTQLFDCLPPREHRFTHAIFRPPPLISNTLCYLFLQHIFWNMFHFSPICFRSSCLASIGLKLTQLSWDIDGERDFNPISVIFLGPLTMSQPTQESLLFAENSIIEKMQSLWDINKDICSPFSINTLESRITR